MIQWGLCCCFAEAPVRFRRATATRVGTCGREEQLRVLSGLVLDNANALLKALETCVALQIPAFRINSELMPLATHPCVGYALEELPDEAEIRRAFDRARLYGAAQGLRLSFHPDQFVVLNSPTPEILENSLRELRHQNNLAEWCGAGEINLHAGGAYGDKKEALKRLEETLENLPPPILARLTLENDDRTYTVADLLPLCRRMNLPLVYDVHHHRVNPDEYSIPAATELAAACWATRKVTPHFHLSSPALPWPQAGDHRPHAAYIDPADIPACWTQLALTVDVEAKAKELAIARLRLESGL